MTRLASAAVAVRPRDPPTVPLSRPRRWPAERMDRLMNSPCVARDTYAGRGPAPRIVRASAAYPHGSGTLLAWESVARGQAVSDTFLFRTGDDYFVHCVYFDGYADEFIVPVDQQTARRLFAFFRAKLTNDDAAFAPSAVARLASGVA